LNRYVVLIPAVIPLAYMVTGLVIYTALVAVGRPPQVSGKKTEVLGEFWSRYIVWLLVPIERAALRVRVTPNTVTLASLVGCAAAGFAVATGHFAMATWLYVVAGLLDIMDGRLARATHQSSDAGAFLDSVLDRWGEFLMFTGLAWAVRGTWAMLATLLALGGSLMVSYTRARGEGLGVKTSGGAMQRPERIILVSLGTMIAAFVDAGPTTEAYVPHVLGVTLGIVGVLSTVTAIGRLLAGYRELRGHAPAIVAVDAAAADAGPIPLGGARPRTARVLRPSWRSTFQRRDAGGL
jgi:phosphatidylglycerophosphate synthase